MKNWIIIISCFILVISLKTQKAPSPVEREGREAVVVVGAEQNNISFPLLKGKRIALSSNHTGMVKDTHILDVLIDNKFNVVAVFSPERGFRGDAGTGDRISSFVDSKTGVPILSLYDDNLGIPSDDSMQKFDILIVDIQDAGLRFYTYYVSMVKLMDACAKFQKKVILLDRPNPNGHYVDEPILDLKGYHFTFTPRSVSAASNPPQKDKLCYGVNLSMLSDEEIREKGIDLSYVIDVYRNLNMDDYFFRPFFENLIGVDYFRNMIKRGNSADEIEAM